MQRRVAELTRSQHSGRTVEFLFSRPIFPTTVFLKRSDIPRPSALRMFKILHDEGILHTVREGAGRRVTIYAFPELLDIAERRGKF